MTVVEGQHGQGHGHGAPPREPVRGLRYLTVAGWPRALLTAALFYGIGTGIVCFFRWLADYDPVYEWQLVTLIGAMVMAPIGFLTGLGAFDYWLYYISGRPTRPEDHSGHGAYSWRDYFRVNTDHKVIGVQYLVHDVHLLRARRADGDDLPRRARAAGSRSSSTRRPSTVSSRCTRP